MIPISRINDQTIENKCNLCFNAGLHIYGLGREPGIVICLSALLIYNVGNWSKTLSNRFCPSRPGIAEPFAFADQQAETMTTDTDYLKSIAEEIVVSPAVNHLRPNYHLQVESKRLEKAIMHSLNAIENFTQRDTFHFNTLSKLVHICDMLFEQTGTVNADVSVLMELLAAVKQIVSSEIRPNLKLSKAFVEIQKGTVLEKWEAQKNILQEQGIEPKLIGIAAIPFTRFIEGNQKLCWGDYTWLKGYQGKLEIMDWDNADCNSKTEALISLLIGRNFNDDRFYIYCKKYIIERTKPITGKRNRVLGYAHCERLVLEDTQVGTVPFDLRANSLSDRLIKWIREEIDFVETHERENAYLKLRLNMYVNRIAFFFKLLHEQKVFGDTSFKELSQQIASTCFSADGEEILASTIISKAYPKDQKMLEEMEGLLVRMLDYVRSFMRGR